MKKWIILLSLVIATVVGVACAGDAAERVRGASGPTSISRTATPTSRPTTTQTIPPTHPTWTRILTPTPTPTPPSCKTQVPTNPWEYDFCLGGSVIYSPPAGFCSYFLCIGNFWNGRGYVIQCRDGAFGKSGGIRGSCSWHGGNLRALYAH